MAISGFLRRIGVLEAKRPKGLSVFYIGMRGADGKVAGFQRIGMQKGGEWPPLPPHLVDLPELGLAGEWKGTPPPADPPDEPAVAYAPTRRQPTPAEPGVFYANGAAYVHGENTGREIPNTAYRPSGGFRPSL
jgi:hypothetical protein